MFTGLIRDGLIIIQNRHFLATKNIGVCIKQSTLLCEGMMVHESCSERGAKLMAISLFNQETFKELI